MIIDRENLVNDYLSKVRAQIEDAIDRVFELATTGDPVIQEITRNLIWMDFYEGWEVFPEVKDKKGRAIGYNFGEGTDSILGRFWFINHFVSHEMLDDGDPGVGWAVSLDGRAARTAFAVIPPSHEFKTDGRFIPAPRRCIVRSRECLCEGESDEAYRTAYGDPEKVLEVICSAIWNQAEYRAWACAFHAKRGVPPRFDDPTANALRAFARKNNIKPAWVQE